jgi:hypothetical protein
MLQVVFVHLVTTKMKTSSVNLVVQNVNNVKDLLITVPNVLIKDNKEPKT